MTSATRNAILAGILSGAVVGAATGAGVAAAASSPGPQGAQGPEGPQGPAGAAGATGAAGSSPTNLGVCVSQTTYTNYNYSPPQTFITNVSVTTPVLANGVESCPVGNFVSITPGGTGGQ
jgi:hypothetical protein